MSTNESALRNLTTDDFIFGDALQAQRFWLTAYDTIQYITSDSNKLAFTNRALSRQFPRRGSVGSLGLAVTNSTITDAIKQFLPSYYKDASHTWLCGQFQTLIARDFLDRVSEAAREGLCFSIPSDKPVVAVGNTFSISAFAVILITCTSAILLYLTHAATNGVRRTFPEIVKDDHDEKRKKEGTLLTSQALSTPPLRYPPAFFPLFYPWMMTAALLSPYTFLWVIFGSRLNRLAYNEALEFLTLRVSTTVSMCLIPLICKFFELPSFASSNMSMFSILMPFAISTFTDMIMLGLLEDFNQSKLLFRDELCSEQFFVTSLTWTRRLVGLKWMVWLGMWIVYAIIYYTLSVLAKAQARNRKDQRQQLLQQWRFGLDQRWSLVHPLKIWPVIELVSLAQASYSIWWIRRRVVEEGVFADFRSAKFDGSTFMAGVLYLLVVGFIALIGMDLKARWNRMVLWSKLDENEMVDEGGDVQDTELDILEAKNNGKWTDIFVAR